MTEPRLVRDVVVTRLNQPISLDLNHLTAFLPAELLDGESNTCRLSMFDRRFYFNKAQMRMGFCKTISRHVRFESFRLSKSILPENRRDSKNAH